ncbi:hypothetical protein EV190_1421, partial [Actinorugispora endophytica]
MRHRMESTIADDNIEFLEGRIQQSEALSDAYAQAASRILIPLVSPDAIEAFLDPTDPETSEDSAPAPGYGSDPVPAYSPDESSPEASPGPVSVERRGQILARTRHEIDQLRQRLDETTAELDRTAPHDHATRDALHTRRTDLATRLDNSVIRYRDHSRALDQDLNPARPTDTTDRPAPPPGLENLPHKQRLEVLDAFHTTERLRDEATEHHTWAANARATGFPHEADWLTREAERLTHQADQLDPRIQQAPRNGPTIAVTEPNGRTDALAIFTARVDTDGTSAPTSPRDTGAPAVDDARERVARAQADVVRFETDLENARTNFALPETDLYHLGGKVEAAQLRVDAARAETDLANTLLADSRGDRAESGRRTAREAADRARTELDRALTDLADAHQAFTDAGGTYTTDGTPTRPQPPTPTDTTPDPTGTPTDSGTPTRTETGDDTQARNREDGDLIASLLRPPVPGSFQDITAFPVFTVEPNGDGDAIPIFVADLDSDSDNDSDNDRPLLRGDDTSDSDSDSRAEEESPASPFSFQDATDVIRSAVDDPQDLGSPGRVQEILDEVDALLEAARPTAPDLSQYQAPSPDQEPDEQAREQAQRVWERDLRAWEVGADMLRDYGRLVLESLATRSPEDHESFMAESARRFRTDPDSAPAALRAYHEHARELAEVLGFTRFPPVVGDPHLTPPVPEAHEAHARAVRLDQDLYAVATQVRAAESVRVETAGLIALRDLVDEDTEVEHGEVLRAVEELTEVLNRVKERNEALADLKERADEASHRSRELLDQAAEQRRVMTARQLELADLRVPPPDDGPPAYPGEAAPTPDHDRLIDEARQRAEELRAQARSYADSADDALLRLTAAREQFHQATTAANNARRNLDEADANLTTTRNRIRQAETTAATTRARLDETVAELTDAREQLDRTPEDDTAARDRLNETVADLTAARDRLQQRIADAAATRDRLNETVPDLTDTRDRAEREAAETATTRDRLRAPVTDLENEYTRLRGQARALHGRADLEQTREQALVRQRDTTAPDPELSPEQQIDQLRQEVQELTARILDLTAQARDKQTESRELNAEFRQALDAGRDDALSLARRLGVTDDPFSLDAATRLRDLRDAETRLHNQLEDQLRFWEEQQFDLNEESERGPSHTWASEVAEANVDFLEERIQQSETVSDAYAQAAALALLPLAGSDAIDAFLIPTDPDTTQDSDPAPGYRSDDRSLDRSGDPGPVPAYSTTEPVSVERRGQTLARTRHEIDQLRRRLDETTAELDRTAPDDHAARDALHARRADLATRLESSTNHYRAHSRALDQDLNPAASTDSETRPTPPPGLENLPHKQRLEALDAFHTIERLRSEAAEHTTWAANARATGFPHEADWLTREAERLTHQTIQFREPLDRIAWNRAALALADVLSPFDDSSPRVASEELILLSASLQDANRAVAEIARQTRQAQGPEDLQRAEELLADLDELARTDRPRPQDQETAPELDRIWELATDLVRDHGRSLVETARNRLADPDAPAPQDGPALTDDYRDQALRLADALGFTTRDLNSDAPDLAPPFPGAREAHALAVQRLRDLTALRRAREAVRLLGLGAAAGPINRGIAELDGAATRAHEGSTRILNRFSALARELREPRISASGPHQGAANALNQSRLLSDIAAGNRRRVRALEQELADLESGSADSTQPFSHFIERSVQEAGRADALLPELVRAQRQLDQTPEGDAARDHLTRTATDLENEYARLREQFLILNVRAGLRYSHAQNPAVLTDPDWLHQQIRDTNAQAEDLSARAEEQLNRYRDLYAQAQAILDPYRDDVPQLARNIGVTADDVFSTEAADQLRDLHNAETDRQRSHQERLVAARNRWVDLRLDANRSARHAWDSEIGRINTALLEERTALGPNIQNIYHRTGEFIRLTTPLPDPMPLEERGRVLARIRHEIDQLRRSLDETTADHGSPTRGELEARIDELTRDHHHHARVQARTLGNTPAFSEQFLPGTEGMPPDLAARVLDTARTIHRLNNEIDEHRAWSRNAHAAGFRRDAEWLDRRADELRDQVNELHAQNQRAIQAGRPTTAEPHDHADDLDVFTVQVGTAGSGQRDVPAPDRSAVDDARERVARAQADVVRFETDLENARVNFALPETDLYHLGGKVEAAQLRVDAARAETD